MGQQVGVGDTTLTKVFVGGLAWETQKEALREHFGRYGEILEAVIISDRATGRSKGYGFVTFKEAEAAKKACEDATPIINGRRANCNLAALGARRPRSSPTRAAPIQPPRAAAAPPSPATAAGPWYYSSGPPPPSPLQHYYRGVPFYAAYGYPPSYLADGSYSTRKLSQSTGGGGAYPRPASYAGHGVLAAPNAPVVPVYPWYHWQQQPQAMGVPTQLFTPTTTTGPITTVPAIVAKPPPAVPHANVEQVTGCS